MVSFLFFFFFIKKKKKNKGRRRMRQLLPAAQLLYNGIKCLWDCGLNDNIPMNWLTSVPSSSLKLHPQLWVKTEQTNEP